MRLVKSVQLVVGFAAVSGAFVLSGNALAADSSSVTNTQSSTSTTSHQIDQSNQTVVTGGSDQSGPGAPTATTTDVTDSSSSNSTSSATPATPGSENGSTPSGPASTSQNDNTSGGGAVTADLSGGMLSSTQLPLPATLDTPSPTTPIVTSPTQAQQNATAATAPSVPVIVFKSQILQVQPTMLNPGVGPAGLAPAAPGQPATAKTPVPPKANGFLASMAEVLAATVVPVYYSPGLATTYLPGLAIGLVTLAVLLISLVVSNYGLWLRLTGFVTAARGDAPAAPAMIFATPCLLSYASASPHLHNSSFMVADYKIRTNWFPML